MGKIVPLGNEFMLTSIIGFIVVAFWPGIWETNKGATIAFTLLLFFTILFISSMISMTYAEEDFEDDLRTISFATLATKKQKKR
ncbi:hypothetical protein D6783_00755 [Candidatus Woesearchaeota archaeon]|nr:MAG: hypothetical protein D6783_00755 [Candidatus Woesearchaeota archaeon]